MEQRAGNLTEALLFLSHFLGDIHQPLHVGFASDMGGNRIKVTWFNTRRVLHHVWDTDVIKRDEGGFNPSNVDQLVRNIQQKIKSKWANQVNAWETCGGDQKTCPNMFAAESIKAACQWAYKGVHPGSVLKDEYYETRLPIVEMRLAQAGIRLAATLNRIFT
ncbi:UNVERIFIED_CONTAM: Endonuclease 2 [Sesamum calycinum]|uniref:Aspergillus nuclease S1 n=1 Tax=Sesamum calycinum TaxID=2727403 RepID=A0AAW2QXI3_9LAMI